MVDRLNKPTQTGTESWRVQEANASKHSQDQDGGHDQNEKEKDHDQFEDLHEKTDWQLLLNNQQHWKQNFQIPKDQIKAMVFKKVNLKTDPSLLRVDIILKDGEIISPAFTTCSRMVGLKIKNLEPGSPLDIDLIVPDAQARITIPSHHEEENKQTNKKQPLVPSDEETTQHNPQSTKRIKKLKSEQDTLNTNTEKFIWVLIGGLLLIAIIGGLILLG